MQLEIKDILLIIKTGAWVLAGVIAGATGVSVWKFKIKAISNRADALENRVTALEEGKVETVLCKGIQSKNDLHFMQEKEWTIEVKQLIRESNEINQRHYEEIMIFLRDNKK